MPSIVVANELLDCLAIDQLVWAPVGDGSFAWRQRIVALDENGQLQFSLGTRVEKPGLADSVLRPPEPGDILELRDTRAIREQLSHLCNRGSVAALFLDYGHTTSGFGDTL